MTLAAAATMPATSARGSADARPEAPPAGDGFEDVLSDVAQAKTTSTSAKRPSEPSGPAAMSKGGAGPTMRAMLGLLKTLPVSACVRLHDAAEADDAARPRAKAAERSDEPADAGSSTNAPDVAPLATLASVLPGLALAGSAASQTSAAKAGAEPQAASLVRNGQPAATHKTSSERESRPSTAVDITVLSSESHLAPARTDAAASKRESDASTVTGAATTPGDALPAAALQSIAGAVRSLAAESSTKTFSAAAPVATKTTPTDPPPPSVAPARSLTLQLAPGALGNLTVRLHLSGDGGLAVHLAVESPTTLAAVVHARSELAAAIGGEYRVDSLVVQASAPPSTSSAGSNDASTSHRRSENGSSGSSGSGDQRDGAGDGGGSRHRSSPERSANEARRGGDRGAGGVFV